MKVWETSSILTPAWRPSRDPVLPILSRGTSEPGDSKGALGPFTYPLSSGPSADHGLAIISKHEKAYEAPRAFIAFECFEYYGQTRTQVFDMTFHTH